jgi:hypothetical protein
VNHKDQPRMSKSMPRGSILLAIALLVQPVLFGTVAATAETRSQRHTTAGTSQDTDVVCRVTTAETFYANQDGSTTSQHQTACIPVTNGSESDDLYNLNLPVNVASKYTSAIAKGILHLSIKGAFLDGEDVNLSNATAYDEVQVFSSRSGVTNYAMGTHTIALVRVSVSDASPTGTATDMKNAFFDSDISTSNQYKACSFGQLNWDPAQVGVLEVTINQPISSFATGTAIVTAAQNQIKSSMGLASVTDLADRIVFCVPPGTGSWAGNAGINHWRVQLNDNWCLSLSASIHEIGMYCTVTKLASLAGF